MPASVDPIELEDKSVDVNNSELQEVQNGDMHVESKEETNMKT